MDIGFDTEFLELGPAHPIALISIGLVAADGREYYAVEAELPQVAVWQHYWLHTNVLPQLPLTPHWAARPYDWLNVRHHSVKRRTRIAVEVAEFLADTPDPVLVTDTGSTDMVLLLQLYGRMGDKPDHIPWDDWDIRQGLRDLGFPPLPPQIGEEHHALNDARWNLEVKRYLDEYRRELIEQRADDA